jgi:hypothetical protein
MSRHQPIGLSQVGSQWSGNAAGALHEVRPAAWFISPYTGWKWAKWPTGMSAGCHPTLNCRRVLKLRTELPISTTSSCRSERSLGSLKLFEQRFSLLQIARAEAFGEARIDWIEKIMRLDSLASFRQEAGH